MSFGISALMTLSIAFIKAGVKEIFECLLSSSNIIRAACKLMRSVTDVILETKGRHWWGSFNVSIGIDRNRVWFFRGTYSHLTNWFLDNNRNKMTLPNEKTSDFFSFFSKHSGLANIGVPPFESGPANPKSVNTISIWVKSVGPFLNFTKKFCGLMSLWVWLWRSSVSRLWNSFKERSY